MWCTISHENDKSTTENKGILPLNLKKLANRVDDLKINLILENAMLLLMLLKL